MQSFSNKKQAGKGAALVVTKDLSQQAVLVSLNASIGYFENQRNRDREYMLDFFEGYTENYVKKYFGSESMQQIPIFTQNLTRRVCSIRSTTYKRPPRMIGESVEEYRNNIDIDGLNAIRRQLERMTFLLGTMAFRCRWNALKGRVEYDLLPFFEPLFLEGENKPYGVMFAIDNHGNERTRKLKYAVWTESRPDYPGMHFLIDSNMKKISVNELDSNPYDTLPVIFVHRSQPVRDWFVAGADDVVRADLSTSVGMTELSLAVRFGAVGIKHITGVDDSSRVELGVDRILYLPEGAGFGISSPSGSLDQIIASLRFMVEATLQNNNIRVKFADERGNAPSAVALSIQEAELIDERIAITEDTWRPFEKARYAVDRKIIEVQTGKQLSEDFQVDFVEPKSIMTIDDEIKYWDWRIRNNLSSVDGNSAHVDWYTYNNPDASAKQIEQFKASMTEVQQTPLLARLSAGR